MANGGGDSAIAGKLGVEVFQVVVCGSSFRGTGPVEGIDALAVVEAGEARAAHHVEEGARLGDAAVPGHDELERAALREDGLQRLHQARIRAATDKLTASHSKVRNRT